MSNVRDGINTNPRFVIVGAGMAGILAAIKLKERGNNNFTVYEKAHEVGGTWRENSYPGVACDVPSHLYSYSFAPNPQWSHFFSPGDEIFKYFKDVAQRFEIYESIHFNSEVKKMTFSDGAWEIEIEDGEKDKADYVISATGVLHHPNYPNIEGLDDFHGYKFHTARWNHSVDLSDKSVGIIGTGSSAVQVISALAGSVKELNVFQRTPQWVLKVPNLEISDEDKGRYMNDPAMLKTVRDELSTLFEINFANAVVDADSNEAKMLQVMCEMNLNDSVKDEVLREKLRPGYRAACKRLVVSPNFYEAFSSSSTNLITENIKRVEPDGIRLADETFIELDVLVLATGFKVDMFMRPIEVIGLKEESLEHVWEERPSAYMAIAIPDFPNMFMLNGPNGPVGNFSLIEVAELQIEYIFALIDFAREQSNGSKNSLKHGIIHPKHAALEAFESERVEATKHTVWVTGCNSWYLDDRGIPQAWPWTFTRFREEMNSPRFEDYELVP